MPAEHAPTRLQAGGNHLPGQYVIARVGTCGPRGRPRSLSFTGSAFSGGSMSGGEGGGKRQRVECLPQVGAAGPANGTLLQVAPAATPPCEDDDGCSDRIAFSAAGRSAPLGAGATCAPLPPSLPAGAASPMLLGAARCAPRVGLGGRRCAAVALFGGGVSASDDDDLLCSHQDQRAGHGLDNALVHVGDDDADEDAFMSDAVLLDAAAAPSPCFFGGGGDGGDDVMVGVCVPAACAPSQDLQLDVARLLGDDGWGPACGAGTGSGAALARDGSCAAGCGAASADDDATGLVVPGTSGGDSPSCSGAELELLGGWELEAAMAAAAAARRAPRH
ncbi:hypothetical protein MNEG_6319 [Monoraphidium neglectum]|uniref:Uncharacterized protein n=1 Tax=Monoraphidium neglectum TaxID=145388 RepID=A0A0D2L335_9CHLO|nr:hypothetical protein MNEG_6319 [Monoraphidium neglectum]KIZ01644.1 hypothetical protein MNEG_6319 [Monoraphidium neglectum]|eukprot:XP_013900663.1 hypothetical protein MNEG_6319 [Monoraphidium neglectum]